MNISSPFLRVIIFISSFLSLIIFPWWVGAIFAILGLIFFNFPEAMILGFIADMLYGVGEPFYMRFVFLFSAFVLYLFLFELKKKIRTNS